jgi:hypothetical protein
MGIVVCITMLIGLSVLQPTPWDSAKQLEHGPNFLLFTAVSLAVFGSWNAVYAYLSLDGFWSWVSLVSGLAMLCASFYVYSERHAEAGAVTPVTLRRKATIAILAISFILYVITLVQLNLGYSIIR